MAGCSAWFGTLQKCLSLIKLTAARLTEEEVTQGLYVSAAQLHALVCQNEASSLTLLRATPQVNVGPYMPEAKSSASGM